MKNIRTEPAGKMSSQRFRNFHLQTPLKSNLYWNQRKESFQLRGRYLEMDSRLTRCGKQSRLIGCRALPGNRYLGMDIYSIVRQGQVDKVVTASHIES